MAEEEERLPCLVVVSLNKPLSVYLFIIILKPCLLIILILINTITNIQLNWMKISNSSPNNFFTLKDNFKLFSNIIIFLV